MKYPPSLVTPASIHTFLTGLLLLLESLDKRELFNSDGDRELPPEETTGLFGKRLFWYLNGLFKEGYQNILKPADLYSMDADLASKERAIVFQKVWAKQDKAKTVPLLRTIINVLWLDLLLPVLPRSIQIATTLSQPYLITAMISFINDRDNPNAINKGYGLIAAFALNYAILAIASSWSAQSMARFMAKLRACLISTLYEQTLHASSKDINLGTATVLITALSSTLGTAATEQRVTAISYVVGNMKGVRMLGLSETVFQMLSKLREVEIAAFVFVRKLLIWITLISNTTFQLTTVSTYVTFAVIMLSKGNNESLDLNKLYGSLSALKLFTTPLTMMLQLLPQMQISYASLERIEKFLKGETISEERSSESSSNSVTEGTELLPLKVSGGNNHLISLDKANFAIDSQPLLFDITTRFSSGTFTMIVGRVGSGKSVFLRSLVGETELTSGQFQHTLSGSAFCDQQVWLRNATIRENIVGEDAFDETWYRKVVWSCGLLQDLQEMKQGEHTAIGSKGISLSGGQKNRISLARALYARRSMFVVDDMLAGLDNTTEKMVFDRVFGRNGLLRKSGATIVLATHATHYSRHADRIIIISDGRIIEQGTYQELAKKNIDFRELNDGTSSEAPDTTNSEEFDSISDDETKLLVQNEPVTADEEEDAARQSGDRRSLVFFIKAVGPLHMTISCVTLAAGIVMTQIQYLWLKWWAEADDKSRSGTIRQLYLFIIVTIVNILAYLVYFAHYALWFTPKMSLNMHASQLVALIRAKFSFLVSTDIGSITNRFSQDIMLVDLQLQIAWLNVTFEVLVTICSIAIMSIATPPVAATVPILGVVGYLIQRVYLRTSRQVRLMDLEAKAPLCTHFIETMAGIVTVRAFGWVSAYRKRNEILLDQSQVPFYLLAAIQNWLTLVLELMVAGIITLVVGLAVGLRNKIDPGFLGLALISAMDLGFNFRIIIVFWTELETSLSAVTRIRQFAATPPEEHENTRADPPGSWPKNGSISFNNLFASYAEDSKAVLQNIELSIEAGEKIGLCGRTGSGKSSLVATLFGLLHQQEGQILIDDIATTDMSLSILRSKIIALPQEPFFLKGTVRYNLAPWIAEAKRPVISDEQMKVALQEVHLWDKLNNTAEGEQSALDINLDHVDSSLSHGERQLFCLARAILMDGKIVVLDEATSSVDAQTDALMQRILRTAFADRTIIAIAHRLDTILDFDRVVVMDAGKIVEVGIPGKLLATEGSLFRALVESQRGA
ncbi:hypothetical protein N0V90_011488 [Kalmusia sp. IMI 367209]|nr:hypothetical protein N0V90_011488 [Kalmusia sp. IMI 367209]